MAGEAMQSATPDQDLDDSRSKRDCLLLKNNRLWAEGYDYHGIATSLLFNVEVNLCCGAVLRYFLAVEFHF